MGESNTIVSAYTVFVLTVVLLSPIEIVCKRDICKRWPVNSSPEDNILGQSLFKLFAPI